MNRRTRQVEHMESKGNNPGGCPDALELNPKMGENQKDDIKYSAESPIFSDFLESTTMHGVRYTSKNYGKPRRLIWGLVIFILVVCLTVSFIQLVVRFTEGGTTTVITHMEASSLEFPAVTICNINFVTKDKLADSPLAASLQSSLGDVRGGENTIMPTGRETSQANTTLGSIDVREEMFRVAHDIKDMLNSCLWLSEYPCSYENFTGMVTNAGACYTFNSGVNTSRPILRVSGSGSENGLSLRLNVEQEKYVSIKDSAAGFRVLLHSPNEGPDEVLERAFFISPGMMTRVSVNKQTLSRLQPYCKNDTGHDYTTYRCRAMCQSIYTESECGCRPYYTEGKGPICSVDATNRCIRESSEACVCSPPCNEETFISSNSFAHFPAESIVSRLTQELNMSRDNIRMNYADLTIFYQSLRVEHSKMEFDYDIYSMFSDLGGSIGLCIGASLLTLLEFAEMFYLKCYQYSVKRS